MTDIPQNLPLAEQPLDDQALLARAFWLLLDHGRPVEVGVLAGALQREPAAVAAAVDRLEQAGLTRRDPAGRLLGSHGLSVAPTHHELLINGRGRWTWCAYDAVGILGALEADGRVRSRSPHSGTLIELTFDAGQPGATEAVVFMAEGPCRSVIDDWCPLVNLFEHDQAAAPGPGSTGSWERPGRSPRRPGSAPPPGGPTYGRGPRQPAAALQLARRRPPVRRGRPMATRIDLGQLQELLDGGGQLVEVLPAAEYADEHLPGAINLPLKQLDATTAARLDRSRPVIVYCWDSL
jgi:hypothetical protein